MNIYVSLFSQPYVGAARVNLLVLLQMLHVEEGLAAVRHRTDEIARSMGIVCPHVNVQIAAPIEHSGMKLPWDAYLLQPMIGHRYV